MIYTRPFRVETDCTNARSFTTWRAAHDYAKWAKNTACYRWAIVRDMSDNGRVIELWDLGSQQYLAPTMTVFGKD